MEKSVTQLMYDITKWTYRHYSRRGPVTPDQKVAWVSSFAPVELLEAMGVAYVYPESYAAVIAASGKEQACLSRADSLGLSLECCGYSSCFIGCLDIGAGPRGLPPKPDLLVVSNNQCTTLVNWWNLLAASMAIPLFVLDYNGRQNQEAYLYHQHRNLIDVLARLTGHDFSESALDARVAMSRVNVALWRDILALYPLADIKAGFLFDCVAPLIGARSRCETSDYYTALLQELKARPSRGVGKRVYWIGYPFWYHPDRCLIPDGAQIVGSNYAAFWNLAFDGSDSMERIGNAYNSTWLNKPYDEQRRLILEDLERTSAQAVIINRNKSCKRDYAAFSEKNCPLPCVSIDSDMVDRGYLNKERESEKIKYLMSLI
jgi:benzoyl-CoA reductase/2-hydroxyglutaryl-CoA dehydratase subunit BcrC/BadD/HgdB